MTLAVFGGKPVITDPIKKFSTIGEEEVEAVAAVCGGYPLSGFLGGVDRGGHWVTSLEERWQEIFRVKHAIACNSATSGLFTACIATQVNSKSNVLTTPFTMSATSAAPALLGANLIYGDIEEKTFNLQPIVPEEMRQGKITHCIVTNLFGHPARLSWWGKAADTYNFKLIEDNAQSPFATCDGKFAGTFGHLGVFSLNVHKHIQVGEGGIIVTDDDDLALRCRRFINHGELSGSITPSLNLRMTEPAAAMAHAQLNKAPTIIRDRQKQALLLRSAVAGFDWIVPPWTYGDCTHVYYSWACKILSSKLNISRDRIVRSIQAEGFPMTPGYVEPLYRMKAFHNPDRPFTLPTTERMHDQELAIVENCTYTFSDRQIAQFTEILKKIETFRDSLRTK